MEERLKTKAPRWLFCLALTLGLMVGITNPAMAQSYEPVNDWATLQYKITNSSTENPVYLKLEKDLSNADSPLKISNHNGKGNKVYLDLNGHSLSRGLSAAQSDGHVIEISGSIRGELILQDTSAAKSGKIIGCSGNSAVIGTIGDASAELTLEGGRVETATSNAISFGAGSTINLNGGEIKCASDNSNLQISSAVLVNNQCTVNWSGTAITTNAGCAVYGYPTSHVNISGGSFTTTSAPYALAGPNVELNITPNLGGKGIALVKDTSFIIINCKLDNTNPIPVVLTNAAMSEKYKGEFTNSDIHDYNDPTKFSTDIEGCDVLKDADNGQLFIGQKFDVTFKVKNGAWNSDKKEDIKVTISGYTDDMMKLKGGQIPAVGDKPDKDYKPGYQAKNWDTVPSAETVITQNTTYTYTYEEKGTQTIKAEDVTATYGKTGVKVEAKVIVPATGGGALSYAVKEGNDVVDIYAATGELTIKKAGTATVTVTASETDNYKQAAKDVTVTINKADAKVKTPPAAQDLTYNGQAQKLVTKGEAVGGTTQYALGTQEKATGEYTDAIPTGTDAGTYYVWYKVKGDDNHNDFLLDHPVTVTIAKAKLTITADSASKEYDGKPLTKDSYKSEGLAQSDTIESVKITGSQKYVGKSDNKAEDAVIKRDQKDAGANYNITYQKGTLEVTDRTQKYEITVEANSGAFPYDGTEKTVSGFKTLTFIEDGVTYTVSGLTAEAKGTEVGEYPVKAEGTAVVTDSEGEDLTAQFNVKTKDGTLTIANPFAEVIKAPKAKDLTYNGQAQELVTAGEATYGTMRYALGADDKTVPAEDKWETTISTGKDAGTYYVWYKAKGDAGYKDSQPGVITVAIHQKALSVTADAKKKAYGEADPELTYTQEGLVEGDTIQGALTRQAGETAGTYEITQGTLTAGDNYIMAYTPALLTITQGDADVKTPPEAKDLTYNGQARELVTPGEPLGGTMEYALGADDKTAPTEGWGATIPSGTPAGTYHVWYRVTGDASHKDVPPKPITVTILPKALSVTADAKSKIYGAADPELTYTQEGLVEGDALQGALTRQAGETVGTYEITQGTLTAGDNYTMAYTPAALTITRARAEVTTPPTAKNLTYNRQAQELVTPGEATSGTMEYALGTDAATAPTEGWKTTVPIGTPAGTYYVWYKAKGDADHEDSQPAVITVVIKKKALVVTADAKSKKYGEVDPELTYTCVGLVEGDAFQGALTRQAGETVGAYPILQGTLTAGDNYIISYGSATFTINKADQKPPSTPVAHLVTAQTITILARYNQEYTISQKYSIDGGETWIKAKPLNRYVIFDNLDPDTTYFIFARMAETDQKNPSGPSDPNRVKTLELGIFKSEISIQGNLPNCEVSGFDAALVRDLCTSEEIKRVEAGADACGSLSITRLDNPSAADQAMCEEAAARIGQNVKIGMYMDISIDKTIGDTQPVKIFDTKGKMINFKFELLEHLMPKKKEILRKFFVFRLHNGKAEQIPVKCGKDYFAFKSDRFSTYALAYQDTPVQNTVGNNNANRAASTGIHGTDTLTVALIIAVVALAIGVAAFVIRRKQKQQ